MLVVIFWWLIILRSADIQPKRIVNDGPLEITITYIIREHYLLYGIIRSKELAAIKMEMKKNSRLTFTEFHTPLIFVHI